MICEIRRHPDDEFLLCNGITSQSTFLSLPSQPKGDFGIHGVQESVSFILGFSVLLTRCQVWRPLIITRVLI